MEVVQGTVVTVDFEIRDPDTGDLKDPDDVSVKVFPRGLSAYTITYSGGEVTRRDKGLYTFLLDTQSSSGLWRYEVDAQGADAVVKQRKIRVTPRFS